MKTKILFTFIVWGLLLPSCQAPTRAYPETMATPTNATVPSLVERGKTYSFSVKTEAGAICHAGINFWDIDESWLHEELPIIKANDSGICQWEWQIPMSAKAGVAGFRGYVEIGEQEDNVFPETFCIEKCDF